MLPDSVLSTQVIARPFVYPRNIPRIALVDYEYGGIAFNDGTQGLRVQVWKGEYIEDQIVLSAAGVAPTPVVTIPDVVDFGFTFDSNMNVFVAYELVNGNAFFYWFDSVGSHYVTTQLPVGSATLRCAHDDNRILETGSSDVILAYCRTGSLYFRAQRERYLTEHLLSDDVGPNGLIQVGMNTGLRFQFQLATSS